jgi:hypothetical protein
MPIQKPDAGPPNSSSGIRKFLSLVKSVFVIRLPPWLSRQVLVHQSGFIW